MLLQLDGRATRRIQLTFSIRLLMTKCRNLPHSSLPGSSYASDYNFPETPETPETADSAHPISKIPAISNQKQKKMKQNSLLYQHAYRRLLFILSLICITGAVFGQGRQITGKVVTNE